LKKVRIDSRDGKEGESGEREKSASAEHQDVRLGRVKYNLEKSRVIMNPTKMRGFLPSRDPSKGLQNRGKSLKGNAQNGGKYHKKPSRCRGKGLTALYRVLTVEEERKEGIKRRDL